MLRDYTCFRYYVRFYAADRVSEIEGRIQRRDHEKFVGGALGLSHYRSRFATGYVRSCAQCIQEDRQKKGFAYYHLEHQLPGVAVCWMHGNPLWIGCAKCGTTSTRNAILSLPGECTCRSYKPLVISKKLPRKLDTLLWIARNSASMLQSPASPIRKDLLWARAEGAGFRQGRNIDWDSVANAFEARYGSETLEWIGYPILTNKRPSNWWAVFLYNSEAVLKPTSITALLYIGLYFESLQSYDAAPEPSPERSPTKRTPAVNAQHCEWRDELGQLLRHSTLLAIARSFGLTVDRVIREALRQTITVPLPNTIASRIGRSAIEGIKKSILKGVPRKKIEGKFQISWYALSQVALSERPLIEAWNARSNWNKAPAWRDRLSSLLLRSTVRVVAKSLGVPETQILGEALRQKLTIPLPDEILARIGTRTVETIKRRRSAGATQRDIIRDFNVRWPDLVQIELSDPRIREAAEAKNLERNAELLAFHRERLSKFLAKRSPVYRGMLSKELGGTYHYLMAHDRAWLASHVPHTAPWSRATPRVKKIDWQHRDRQFVGEVRAAYKKLTSGPGNPGRLSRSKLLEEAGLEKAFTNGRALLPQTEKLLQKLGESKSDCHERRIRWGLKEIANSNHIFTISMLRVRSGVSPETLRAHASMIRQIAKRLGLLLEVGRMDPTVWI